MRVRILVLTLLALAVRPVGAGDRVALRVSPRLAFAPADLNVSTTIQTDIDNRTVEVIAESDHFYRSSELPLDGDRAPRTTFVQFRSLPSGSYLIRVIVRGVEGRALAVSEAMVTVVGRQ